MKTKTLQNRSGLPSLLIGMAMSAFAATAVFANPYATCLTNSGGIISFRLNEDADNVKVIYDGGATTNDLGALAKGLQTVPLSITGTFRIQVSKAAGAGYLQGTVNQISVNANNLVKSTNQRGLVVNKNPASPYFGRIYVSVGSRGTNNSRIVSDGIYLLNADQTDAVGQGDTPRTGGIKFDFYAANAESPGRLALGPDDNLYIADWSDANGGLWMTDPDVATNSIATNVLFGIGGPTLETNIHGSISGMYVEGSLAGGNLVVYTADEDIDPGNAVLRYDIGSGPLPYAGAGSQAFTFGLAAQLSKILRGPGGYWYCSNRRADYATTAGLFVRDNTGAALWDSRTAWRAFIGNPTANDSYFSETRGFDVTPDGKYLATLKALTNLTATPYNVAGNTVMLLPLEAGIPNITNLIMMPTTPATGIGRDLAFDAAGNLYTISADQGLRIYAPGGTSVATTGSDGTFSSSRTQPDVFVAATLPNASENGTVGQFTLTRAAGADGYGNTNSALTVGYKVSGTALNGVDYTTLSGAVTFAPGQNTATISVSPLADALSEPTESVVVTLTNSPDYIAIGNAVTIWISDLNTPVLAPSSISPSMYERTVNDFAAVVVSRPLGNTNTDVTLDTTSFTYSGTAVMGVDYVVNSNLFPHFMFAGERSTTIRIVSPLNDAILKGNRTLVIGMAAGTGYTPGTDTVTTTIIEDEDPPEVVLWSDDFNSADSATNYLVKVGSFDGIEDYTATFGYDYQAFLALPPAPHSTTDSLGLALNVNKVEPAASAIGINFYATNKVVGTNFALRFDMFLFCGSTATTEYSIFGINHTGNQTNWFRYNNYGFTNSAFDGLFAAVESDASGVDDYLLLTGPKTTNSGIVQPTIRARNNAVTLGQVFKNPPYSPGSTASGSPANLGSSATPTWAEVELAQVLNQAGQRVITLRINHSIIYQYTNTLANTVAATNGYVMLGYCDAYGSIGDSAGAIYDNVRVVSLDPPTITTQPLGAIIPAGGSTNLTIAAAGSTTGTLTYQWRLNGVNIAGATGTTLALGNIQVAHYGDYTVLVSDGVYSVTSAKATVAPPAIEIITPPAGRAVLLGQSVNFTVVAATYSGVTNYQWRLYSTNLVNQTNTTLSIPSVQSSSYGPYTVRVSDGYTAVTSVVANLTVPVQPKLTTVVSGTDLTLSFATESGLTYVVEHKTNLIDAVWYLLQSFPGNGSPVTVIESTTNAPSQFYRVRVE